MHYFNTFRRSCNYIYANIYKTNEIENTANKLAYRLTNRQKMRIVTCARHATSVNHTMLFLKKKSYLMPLLPRILSMVS